MLMKWNRPVAVVLACVLGLAVVVFLPPVLAQQPEDKEKQAQKALEDAKARLIEVEARLKEAQEQLRAAQANHDKAKAAKNAVVWGAALRQQLQSLNWVFVRVEDPTKRTIAVKSSDHHGVRPGQRLDTMSLTLFFAKDVKVFVDGQEGSVTDLGEGMKVSLRLAENQPEVTRIDATSNKQAQREQVIKAVDVAKKTISVTIDGKVTLEGLPIRAGRGRVYIVDREGDDRGSIEDLRPGMRVDFLELSLQHGQLVVSTLEVRK